METNNLFRLVGMDLLFENTNVPNVGGISLNNLKRLNGWDDKTTQCLDMELNFFDNKGMDISPWRRIFLKSIKKWLTLLTEILIKISNIVKRSKEPLDLGFLKNFIRKLISKLDDSANWTYFRLMVLYPRNRMLVWNNLILVAKTTKPLTLTTSRTEFKCFQCSSMDLEKMRTSSI
jgi:hypothetical protein